MLGPVLEKLAKEANGAWALVKVNTDQNQALAMRYGIQGIPAVKAFRDGAVVAEFVGALPEPQVRQFVQKLAATKGDPAEPAGVALLAAHRWSEAEAAFRRAMDHGDNAGDGLGLARALIAQGKGSEAEQALDAAKSDAEGVAGDRLRATARWLIWSRSEVDDAGATNADALFRRAGRAATAGDIEGALAGLISVLQSDRRYRAGEAQKIMLAYFELLGDSDPLTRAYRSRLASVLF
jgi:putative thioredoxin